MLTDLDETLKELLIQEIPIPNGEIEISFDPPKRDWSAGRVKPTLNLYLYDIVENTELRRNDWVVERGQKSQATKYRPPRRINLTYLVTAWAGEIEDEHRLMWRALAALMRQPELPEAVLQGDLKAASEPIQAYILSADKIPNPADMWSALDNEFRAALHYQVVLPLDVAKRFTGPMVFTKQVRVEQGLEGAGPFEEIWQIAGTVRDAKRRPIPHAEVTVKERGLTTQADAEGHYTFPNLTPGSYTFVVVAPEGKPREQAITVSGPSYDLSG